MPGKFLIEGTERHKRVQASQRIMTDLKNTSMTCFARKTIAGKGLRRLNLSIALVVPDEIIVAISGDGICFLFGMQNGFPDYFDSADHWYYPEEVTEDAN